MKQDQEEKIQKKIRARAFERLDALQQEKQKLLSTEYTLGALHEVTGIPYEELKAIANEVRYFYEWDDKDFFSIKNQVLMVFGSCGLLVLIFWILPGKLF
jgi:hypothetical protein